MTLFYNSMIINALDCFVPRNDVWHVLSFTPPWLQIIPIRNEGHSTSVIARNEVTKQSSLSVIPGCLIFHTHYRWQVPFSSLRAWPAMTFGCHCWRKIRMDGNPPFLTPSMGGGRGRLPEKTRINTGAQYFFSLYFCSVKLTSIFRDCYWSKIKN